MAKTKTITLYNFDELNDEAKETARNWFRECMDHDWYETVYEDAENIGLRITSFDIGRSNEIEGKFIESARECAQQIVDEHGDTCETYKTAEKFLKERDEIVDTAERDENGDFVSEYELDQKLDECEEQFLKSILEDYLVNLRNEYEYINSDESVDESIMANEYTFRENGRRED